MNAKWLSDITLRAPVSHRSIGMADRRTSRLSLIAACMLVTMTGCDEQPSPPGDYTAERNVEVDTDLRHYQLPACVKTFYPDGEATSINDEDSFPIQIIESGCSDSDRRITDEVLAEVEVGDVVTYKNADRISDIDNPHAFKLEKGELLSDHVWARRITEKSCNGRRLETEQADIAYLARSAQWDDDDFQDKTVSPYTRRLDGDSPEECSTSDKETLSDNSWLHYEWVVDEVLGANDGTKITIKKCSFINLDVDFDFGAKFNGPFQLFSLNYFKALVKGKLHANINYSIEVAESITDGPALNRNIWEAPLETFVFDVAGIPVAVMVNGALDAEARLKEAALDVLVEGNVQFESQIELGPIYDGGDWNFEHTTSGSPTHTIDKADTRGHLDVEFVLKPSVEALLYGLAGPEVGVGPYVELEIDEDNGTFDLKGKLGLEAGVQVQLKFAELLGVPGVDISAFEETVRFAEISF